MAKNVTVVVVNTDTGKILAVPRKDNPNDWGLPGGKLNEQEDLYTAAIRELWEETRYYVAAARDLELLYHDSDSYTYTFIARKAVFVSLAAPSPDEPEAKFVDASELIKGSFGDYNSQVITQLIKWLAYNHKA